MGFYEDEIQRVKDALTKADPLSEDYSRGIAAISNLRWLRDCEVGSIGECGAPNQIEFTKDEPAPTPEPEPIKEEEFPAEEPTPFPEEPAKKWTKAEVRERLAELKKAGKDLKELFKQFSASKLSDVKEEDYPALMAKAEEM
jgi:hypothetical protein